MLLYHDESQLLEYPPELTYIHPPIPHENFLPHPKQPTDLEYQFAVFWRSTHPLLLLD